MLANCRILKTDASVHKQVNNAHFDLFKMNFWPDLLPVRNILCFRFNRSFDQLTKKGR